MVSAITRVKNCSLFPSPLEGRGPSFPSCTWERRFPPKLCLGTAPGVGSLRTTYEGRKKPLINEENRATNNYHLDPLIRIAFLSPETVCRQGIFPYKTARNPIHFLRHTVDYQRYRSGYIRHASGSKRCRPGLKRCAAGNKRSNNDTLRVIVPHFSIKTRRNPKKRHFTKSLCAPKGAKKA